MKAHIINIGDELLIGDTVNTNASWMASSLDQTGFEVNQIKVVGDNEEEITDALNGSLAISDLVLITGGLGPTHDDITKHTLCKFYNDTLIRNDEVLEDVKELLSKFGKEINALNKTQAMVPSKCEVLRNDRGTAPGMFFEEVGKIVISMPGVPHEMKAMMKDSVLPKISKHNSGNIRHHRYMKTFGIAEANLAEMLKEIIQNMNPKVSLAFLPSPGQVKMRLTATGNNKKELENILMEEERHFIDILGDKLFGFSNDSMESVLGELLKSKGKTLATAESCTGGRLASKITSIAGSSAYYTGSIIAYSNDIKIRELNVPENLLEEKGAVSEEVVKKMAEGVRLKFKTAIGLSTSGIAGPDGGTDEKPVGTIWIGISMEGFEKAVEVKLKFDRKVNIELTSDHAMNLLRRELIGKV